VHLGARETLFVVVPRDVKPMRSQSRLDSSETTAGYSHLHPRQIAEWDFPRSHGSDPTTPPNPQSLLSCRPPDSLACLRQIEAS
jgi:hypothetical protein